MRQRSAGSLVQFCLAWMLLLGTLGSAGLGVLAQTVSAPATTAVTDTIYRADGTAAAGTVLISWPAFTLATGASVPAGSTSVTLGAGGALSVHLVANAGATPMGSYYTVVYHLDDGSVTREYWVVPVQPASVKVSNIRSTVLPASVAMQTVSKAYVDTAIANAVGGHPLDSSTPYVLKTGDTMTGPLVLPGEPATPLEAADKNYVDTQVTALGTGLQQKVSTTPQTTQVVTQPAGTDLETNALNGTLYAKQYVTGAGTNNPNNNGIANVTASPDCANGCDVVADHGYASAEIVQPTTFTNGTHVEDRRAGAKADSYLNPQQGQVAAAQTINLVSTESAAAIHAATGGDQIFSVGLDVNSSGLTGGNNVFPREIQQTFPYFKSTYSAANFTGNYNTPGQHVLVNNATNCYGVGDCLLGSQFLTSSGGFRDDADEGAHPFDIYNAEDSVVFQGVCGTGCTTGSSLVQVAVTVGPRTQGEGRYLIDKNPAKVISTGVLTGGLTTGRQPSASFAGTSFPVSTFLETAQTIPGQVDNIAPGTVTVPIQTSAVPAGFATNTAALPATTGVACVVDAQQADTRPLQFETAAYQVVDGSHIQLTLQRPHGAGATLAVGGLCGYGLEQTTDTLNGIRQVFPVIGSTSASSLLYAGGSTSIVGRQNTTSSFASYSLVIASIARSNNVVTLTFAGSGDPNGLAMTVQGVADPSYNGTFVVTSTAANTLTYVNNGPDSTSAGGTVTYLTGGYALYPMAEVVGVYNAATKAVDGQLQLAANTVNWAFGDDVEEPHYFQEQVHGDTEGIFQVEPRPVRQQSRGVAYAGNVGPGVTGFRVENDVAASQYIGNAGTHTAPDNALSVTGVWQRSLEMQAGETTAIALHCNSHGCDRWDSDYNIFTMDTSAGQDVMHYSPSSSALYLGLRGTGYTFTTQAFTAGTINVTTLNAGSVHGLFTGSVAASSLPVFAGSGSAHAVGAVPDPGVTPGTTRYLREDGTWSTPAGGGGAAATSGGPANLPQRASLLGEYLMNEGAGTIAHDTSGAAHDGTINGATWEGTQDLNFTAQGQYVQLPTAVNAARTWQFALYAPVFGAQTQPQAPGYGDAANFPANPSLLCGTTAQHLCLVAGSAGKSMSFRAMTDNTQAGEPMSAGWHVLTVVCGSNVGGVVSKTRYLYDGAEVGSYLAQGDAGTCASPATGNYQIGGSAQFTQSWFLGKVAATWAWSTPLSMGDAVSAAQSALAYLKQKGVQTEFRKVRQPAPVILAGLDDRTSGLGLPAGSNWLAQMSLSDSTYARVNLGSAGAMAYDACNQFGLTFGSQLGRNGSSAIVMVWGGANDLLGSTQTPRQVADSLHCVVQQAKQAGATVVLATEISCGNGGTCDANRDALNVILRREASGWGVDNLADLAQEPSVGVDGATSNAFYFPDHLHPGPQAEPNITAILQNAVNELLGTTELQRHLTTSTSYQEQAGDRYLDLYGNQAQAISLPSCVGISLPRYVLNQGTQTSTVAPPDGGFLLGIATVPAGAKAVFLPVPQGPAQGGCYWERTQ